MDKIDELLANVTKMWTVYVLCVILI